MGTEHSASKGAVLICQELRLLHPEASADAEGPCCCPRQDHSIPSIDLVVEVASEANVSLVRAIVLALKSLWEVHVWKSLGRRAGTGTLVEAYRNLDRSGTATRSFGFNAARLLRRFRQAGWREELHGFTEESFDLLVRQVVLAGHHLRRLSSPDITALERRTSKQALVAAASSPEQRQTHHELQVTWMENQEKLEDTLLMIEDRRLLSTHTDQRWYAAFGREEIELRELTLLVTRLQQQVELKEANPAWDLERIDDQAERVQSARKRELQELRQRVLLAAHRPPRLERGHILPPEEYAEYQQKCKRALVTILRLVHPVLNEVAGTHAGWTPSQKHGA